MHPSQLLLDISTHALLHIEFKKLERHLSTADKNQLLVQFIKPVVKSSRFRAVKKTTKQWLLAGRRPNIDFEAFLGLEHASLVETCATDLHQFVNLIMRVESELKTKVQYSLAKDIDLDARFGDVLICVVDESLNASFDEDGLMTRTTQLLFIGDMARKDLFSDIVEQDAHFQAIVAYEDEQHLRIELLRC
ncbi:DUF2913 family protein [Vibrio sp. ZSDE26]|uniref:DUF2913 family protein n=1 Tax=Vibrio amylolyticus TaxID=2847292 RepID=A0A9X1XJ35_9VIBR|nr:DUF2913 family protein [Vibrio amylolyticus]MCK6263864.1 DUF2913 family protein [Vibrio amylolyticus]